MTHGVLVSTIPDQDGSTGTSCGTGGGGVQSSVRLSSRSSAGRVESVTGSSSPDVGSDDGGGTEPERLGGCSCERHGRGIEFVFMRVLRGGKEKRQR